MLAAKAVEEQKELDSKTLHYLCEKLVQFMEYRESFDEHLDAEKVAESLIRLMPCIKMVI